MRRPVMRRRKLNNSYGKKNSMLKCDATQDEVVDMLQRTGAGDGAAFRDLHRACATRLLSFAWRIVKSRDAAEDVLQESFIVIWRDAARFDGARSAPMTWMMTIVRNKAIDFLRSNVLRERLTDAGQYGLPGVDLDPGASPCEMVESVQRNRQLRNELTTLGSLPRQAIELAFYHDMTHGEVALQMTIPLGTVKTWIRRGCLQMRAQLERPCMAPPAQRSVQHRAAR